MRTIALSSSDWHLHDWKQHNEQWERIFVSDQFLLELIQRSDEEGIPILFSGDMFHTPQGLSNSLLNHYISFLGYIISHN